MGRKTKNTKVINLPNDVSLKRLRQERVSLFENSVNQYYENGIYVDSDLEVASYGGDYGTGIVLLDGIELYRIYEFKRSHNGTVIGQGAYGSSSSVGTPFNMSPYIGYEKIKHSIESTGVDRSGCYIIQQYTTPAKKPTSTLLGILNSKQPQRNIELPLEELAKHPKTFGSRLFKFDVRRLSITNRYIVKNLYVSFAISFETAPYVSIRVFDVHSHKKIKESNGDPLSIKPSKIKNVNSCILLGLNKPQNIDLIKDMFKGHSLSNKQKAILNNMRYKYPKFHFGNGECADYFQYHKWYKKNNKPRRLYNNKPKKIRR